MQRNWSDSDRQSIDNRIGTAFVTFRLTTSFVLNRTKIISSLDVCGPMLQQSWLTDCDEASATQAYHLHYLFSPEPFINPLSSTEILLFG